MTAGRLATARTVRYRAAMHATTRLAEFVVKSTLRDCPEAAIAATRRAALDSFGVTLAGAREPVARAVRAVARAEGGVPLCTVTPLVAGATASFARLEIGRLVVSLKRLDGSDVDAPFVVVCSPAL